MNSLHFQRCLPLILCSSGVDSAFSETSSTSSDTDLDATITDVLKKAVQEAQKALIKKSPSDFDVTFDSHFSSIDVSKSILQYKYNVHAYNTVRKSMTNGLTFFLN